ncbi:hypothetical protein IWW34DRAFT_218017 [Fusarium oxysporum f. sp. albedinis]|nr:hypothetical protein IWW34DRAFT_218017 [Fusarium oxysporum f. sp. albedinis]KAJ0132301.1 Uncharacterized protein HZ326_24619 [Fusarium oxysporum f. sp. albedinis]KAK2470499.1 hypothetical protein H9L39_18116 [Fusarium oxysporum f. sp. albedinis]
MSGLELPAFIVGLSGLIAVFENSFAVWRTVRAAHGFGSDVADTLSMLEMEFFRFQTWWTALQHLATTRKAPQISVRHGGTLHVSLQTNMCQPIVGAAEKVLRLLEDVEALLRENRVLAAMEERPTQVTQPAAVSITYLRSRQAEFAQELSKKTPWHRRLLHNIDLWKNESDRTLLRSKLDDIIYWNDTLYSILPQNLRDSILETGIAGYVLEIPGDVQGHSTSRRGSRLRQSAILRENRRLLNSQQPYGEDKKKLQEQLDRTRKAPSWFHRPKPSAVPRDARYTIAEYVPKTHGDENDEKECRVLIEWYPFPKGDLLEVARSRMAQISYMLKAGQGAANLSTLDALGYIEDGDSRRFGLVLQLPVIAVSSAQPTTLHDLLSRKGPSTPRAPAAIAHIFTLPALDRRYELAAAIASGFYSFMLARWHHERFSSLRIAFLLKRPRVGGDGNAAPDISAPIIGGFDISRPASAAQVSVQTFAPPTATELLYLHPRLRESLAKVKTVTGSGTATDAQDLPRFQRIFDIYAFGLFLAEVGFWNTISRIAQGAAGVGFKKNPTELSAPQFRAAVIRKCTDDLACWMGETYRDITLACLAAEDSESADVDSQEGTQELNNFYWDVVVKLLQLSGDQ